jgi:hypothetical protein
MSFKAQLEPKASQKPQELSKEFLDFCKCHVVNGVLASESVHNFGYAIVINKELKKIIFISGKDQNIPLEYLNTLYKLQLLVITNTDILEALVVHHKLFSKAQPPVIQKLNKTLAAFTTVHGADVKVMNIGVYKPVFVPLKRYNKHGFSPSV